MKLIVFACGSQHDSKGVCMCVYMHVCALKYVHVYM